MDNTKFLDPYVNSYYLELREALKIEIHYLNDVTQGVQALIPDIINRHIIIMNNLLGNIGNTIVAGSIPVAAINAIAQTVTTIRDNRAINEKSDFVFNTRKFRSARTEFIFEVVAREAAYRYGTCILNIMSLDQNIRRANIPNILAKVGAIRIMHYALKNDIWNFEDCELIVQGLTEGFPGFETHGDYNNFLSNISLLETVAGAKSYTVERFYGKSGYTLPGLETQFYIDGKHKCCDRIPEVVNFNSDNNFIPKYGYAQFREGHPLPINLRLHHPPNHPKKEHVYGFQFRYITLLHVEKYLTYCNSFDKNFALRLPFNDWLMHQYPEQFKSNVKFTAVFRGTIDGLVLTRKGLNFENGDFTRTDFSHSHFIDVSIGLMRNSFLIHCYFTRVSVERQAIHLSQLDLSHFDSCNFVNLEGQLSLNYIECTKSKWSFSVGCLYSITDSILYDINYYVENVEPVRIVNESGLDLKSNEEIGRKFKIFEGQLRYFMSLAHDHAADKRSNRHLANIVTDLEQKVSIITATNIQIENNVVPVSRIQAVNLATLPSVMDGIILENLIENAVLQVLEALYFSKLRAYLANITGKGRTIEWYTLSRVCEYRTDGKDGTNGEDGANGTNGANGGGSGVNGGAGMAARHGTSAMENKVAIMSLPGQNVFAVTPAGKADTVLLPLFDSLVKVILSAMGGRGGTGGKGGKGGDGGNGFDGIDATERGAGTAGTNGGNGGSGGNAGAGGNSGHSNSITIHIKETDTDLLVLVELHNSFVPGGLPGFKGLGGIGGAGGRGGRECNYDETIETYDSKGNSHRSYVRRRNPGGADGAAGRMGGDGLEAPIGADGLAGHVDFVVIPCHPGSILSTYNEIYDLRFNGCNPIASDTGIIEPGQVVEVRNISIRNIGELGSPANRVIVEVFGNEAFHSDNWSRELLANSILCNREEVVPSLKIAVNHFAIPDFNTVFKLNTQLTLEAYLPRVQRSFIPFSTVLPLTIRYPVELSLVRGPEALVANQMMPISLIVKNISKVNIGRQANWNRLLWITMEALSGVDVSDLNPIFHIPRTEALLLAPPPPPDVPMPTIVYDEYSLNTPLIYDIDLLTSESSIELHGFLTLSQIPEKWVHNTLSLSFSLTLGDINFPMHSSSAYMVQRELYDFQLACERRSFSRNDLLLVINSTTSKAEIEHWNRIAITLEKQLLLWNVSVYKGFSFTYSEFNVMQNMEGGIVVFLNTPFRRDDRLVLDTGVYDQRAFHPIDYLEESELFEASRRMGIKIYVISTDVSKSSFDLRDKSSPKKACEVPAENRYKNRKDLVLKTSTKPVDHDGKLKPLQREERLPAAYDLVTLKNLRLLGQPTINVFTNKIAKIQELLQKQCPGEEYFYNSSFDTRKVGSSFLLNRYEVGVVEVRRGLDITYSSIAVRNSGDGQSNPLDLDIVVKLIPFSEKLDLMTKVLPGTNIQVILTRQIISDLIDEQIVYYRHYLKYGTLSLPQLECHLVSLKAFQAYNFFPYLEANRDSAKTILLDIIVKLRYFATFYPRGIFTNINLKEIVRLTCLQILERYVSFFGTISLQDFRGLRAACRGLLQASDITIAYKKLSDSMNMEEKNITFNNWLSRDISDYIVFNETPKTPSTHQLITEVVSADVTNNSVDLSIKASWLRYCNFRDKEPAASIYPPVGDVYGRSIANINRAIDNQIRNSGTYIGHHPGYGDGNFDENEAEVEEEVVIVEEEVVEEVVVVEVEVGSNVDDA